MTKLILPIVFILGAIGLFFYFTKPVQSEISLLKERRAEFEEVLVKARELDQVRANLVAQYASIPSEDLERLSKMLPSSVDNVRLIIEMDTIAARNDMQVRDISFERQNVRAVGRGGNSGAETEAENPGVQSMVFRFNVSGTYEQFFTFISDIEQNLRLIDLASLSFSSSENEPYTYTVAIKTYWMPSK